MPILRTGVQYSGIWTLQQAHDAVAVGTWPTIGPALYLWGGNNYGGLGLGDINNRSSPTQVGTLKTWSSFSGFYSTIATKTDGTLWSWGYNNTGELGLGNTTSYSSPKQVGSLTSWLQTACGEYHTLTIKNT